MIKKERIQKWDILKFILIFFVVLGHFCEQQSGLSGLKFYIYTFHMPLFIFISGLFSKRTVNENRYGKVFPYLVMFLVMKFIDFIRRILIYKTAEFSLFKEAGSPWFMLALFTFYFITMAVKNISPKYILCISILLACLAGYDESIGDFLSLSRLITFYPFFYLGYITDAAKTQAFLSGKKIRIVSACTLSFYGIIVYFICAAGLNKYLFGILTGKHPFSVLQSFEPYGGLIRLVYYAVVIAVSAAVISMTPSETKSGRMAEWGSRSIQVYALHYVLVDLFYVTLNMEDTAAKIMPAFPGFVVFPLTVLVVALCTLKFWKPAFDFILKPGKRKITQSKNNNA